MLKIIEKVREMLPFQKSRLSKEAFIAYFNRLPSEIKVNWFRDGHFIVGRIFVAHREFVTQGRNPMEFIEMVNDAVYTVFDIPRDYIDSLKQVRTYMPSPEEEDKLVNSKVINSNPHFIKSKEVLSFS